MAVLVQHSLNRGNISAVLRNQGGSLSQEMLRRGIRVQTAARREITAMGAVDTGRLRSSINVRQRPSARGIVTIVGSDVEYAIFVHEGTNPHEIFPINAQALRFRSGGQIVYARHVQHPGTAARPFLTNALTAASGV